MKSLIFWIILILVVFMVFQCTQKSENNKQASALMYERLYHCAKEIPATQTAQLQQLQSKVKAELSQQEAMQLINDCRKNVPLQSSDHYIQAIKQLNIKP